MVDATSGQTLVTSASEAIESLAWRLSRCIYAYDVALLHNFGVHAKEWRVSGQEGPQVIEMQTRPGAGLGIVGRMSEGTSSEVSLSSFALSAFTTPTGLVQMMPALANLPEPTISNRLVIQVPSITTLDKTLALSPSLANIGSILPIVPENLAILASSTAQEAVDLTLAAYSATSSHVVHVFDHFSSARELRKLSIPALPVYDTNKSSSSSLQEALGGAGYTPFDYDGPQSATEVFVVVNGILANAIKALLKRNNSAGVVTVRLLRPWDGSRFLAALPQSARHIHVLDDVALPIVEGPLYHEVLSTFYECAESIPEISSIRVTPTELHTYLTTTSKLGELLSTAVPSLTSLKQGARPTVLKRVAFWSTFGTPTTPLPEQIARPLLNAKAIHARLLSASDVFAKPGGVTLSRLTLSATSDVSEDPYVPMEIVMPLVGAGRDGADFTAILDPSLLKSHDALRASLPGSPVLVYTSWSPTELIENLHPANAALASRRDLQIYTFDASSLGTGDVQRALAHAAFLRLYVGGDATFDTFERVCHGVIGDDVSGVPVRRLVGVVWDGLQNVVLRLPTDVNGSSSARKGEIAPLRPFEFNTISLTGFAEAVAGERQEPISGPWHEAAKHILFHEAYSAASGSDSGVPALDALRPELPIQTFLVTCTVNQRLTPKTYNRNLFHMEFDTAGTGLTYKLGEALGVHGWNDDGDVLEFCKWYGVDPDMLVSVPLPATQRGSSDGKEKRKVTRTVFQALQQQIDIFGRPGKSFFGALATFATNRREKMALRFIAAPEGAATLKKLGEKDTVSYADVLSLYPSARPSIEQLVVIVDEIKERHYSIASAQSVVGNRVDLLVVTVDWVTPNGKSGPLFLAPTT